MPEKKKKKKKARKIEVVEEIEPDTSPKGLALVLWNFLGFFVTICGLVLIICACMPAWRELNASVYRYTNTSSKTTSSSYAVTQFGLFTHRFNDGAVSRPIAQSASLVCAIADSESSSSVLDLLASNGCGTVCLSHYQTRCSVYRKVAQCGYIALALFIVAGLAFVSGGVWTMVFGRSYSVLFCFWGFAVMAGWFAMMYWWWITADGFRSLKSTSQFPSVHLGYAAVASGYALAVGTWAVFCTAIAWMLKDFIDFEKRKDEVDMHLLYDGAGQLGAFGPTDYARGPPQFMQQPGTPAGQQQTQRLSLSGYPGMMMQPQSAAQQNSPGAMRGGAGGGRRSVNSHMMQQPPHSPLPLQPPGLGGPRPPMMMGGPPGTRMMPPSAQQGYGLPPGFR